MTGKNVSQENFITTEPTWGLPGGSETPHVLQCRATEPPSTKRPVPTLPRQQLPVPRAEKRSQEPHKPKDAISEALSLDGALRNPLSAQKELGGTASHSQMRQSG